VQYYALRAAEVADLWAASFGDTAPERLIRVIATQTAWQGLEDQILNAPRVVAEGRRPPVDSFDAYAVTGYFANGLGAPEKTDQVKAWLTASAERAADEARNQGLTGAASTDYIQTHRYDLATDLATADLENGSISGSSVDTVDGLVTRLLPYHAKVAADQGLQLVMYEGGTHVVGLGALVEDQALTAFFTHLNYSPQMGALYARLQQGWARLTDAPFNAFVDVAAPGKWGSWGALRHLGDDNPRWQSLAQGCATC
jgi:hypothetical protein